MRTCWVLIILALCLNAQNIPADYKAYLDALAYSGGARHIDALQALETVWAFRPESPLVGRAAVLASQSYGALGRPKDAVDLLRRHRDELPQPEGDAALAGAAEAAGDVVAAAAAWQSVYYRYPLSEQADHAEAALARLRPKPVAEAVFSRAEKLRRAGQAARAKRELLTAAARFTGLDRQLATVRAHFGEYRALAALSTTDPQAEAERLYLMHAAARRQSMEPQAEAAMRTLNRRFPKSRWALEALVSWGNHHLLRNNVAGFEPLYRACYLRFPDDPQAAYCHWKVAWSSWMQRKPGARRMLEDHVSRYPESDKRSAALYFLGRYEEAQRGHPMSWYAVLSRGRSPLRAVSSLDSNLFTPSPVMEARIARARQLDAAALYEWAELELKYAAREQPFVAAMELAEVASKRGAHDQALRYIKGVAKGYLTLPFDAAPERFWRLAFPLPWRSDIERYSRARDLEPAVVAALIRQESEFNPNAVSRAQAYGLTQVLPSTGRQLSRRLSIGRFHTSMLFDPSVNLNLGTYYLRSILDAHDGRWEVSLAAYNAGKTRTDLWQTWYNYREPAEFVETIPFTETRNYVQIVLRNADVYRRLYDRTK
jgi:soluble lytic murein transglycosylase